MIQETIERIEARLHGAENLPPEKRAELLQLVAALKSEVEALSKTHQEEAQSIAGFTHLSTQEATRTEVNPRLLKHSLAGLAVSAEDFKESHPRLVQAVNSICTTLANLGI